MSSTTSSCGSAGSDSDNDEDDVNNVCVICLDGLLTASNKNSSSSNNNNNNNNNNNTDSDSLCDIGVATPCGHPVHESCFQQWSAFQKVGSPNNNNKRTTAARPVPCPTCQQDTESFVKVFLRVERDNNKSKKDEKSDEISGSDGSDSEQDDDDDDHEEENDENDNSIQAQPPARRIQPRRKSTLRNTDVTSPLKLRSMTTASSKTKGRQPAGKKMNHHKSNKNKKKSHHYKKAQWYKKRWLGACEQVKTLRLEAQNRQKCHHQDQLELDRTRSICYKLVNELDTLLKMARFRRNAVGLFCFGLGWIASTKLVKHDA